MNIIDRLKAGLDIQQPNWWIDFANQQELKDFARQVTDKKSGTVRAATNLRQQVVDRLFSVLRAAYTVGIFTIKIEDGEIIEVINPDG